MTLADIQSYANCAIDELTTAACENRSAIIPPRAAYILLKL